MAHLKKAYSNSCLDNTITNMNFNISQISRKNILNQLQSLKHRFKLKPLGQNFECLTPAGCCCFCGRFEEP